MSVVKRYIFLFFVLTYNILYYKILQAQYIEVFVGANGGTAG